MKIAIDIRKIGKKSTGDEVYTYYLVCELAKLEESKKHKFLLLTDENTAKIRKLFPKLPGNFKIYKVVPTPKALWTFYSLPKFLKKNPVDVLHVQYISPFNLNKKIKLVSTIHDVSFKANPKWIAKKDSLFLSTLIPLSLKRLDAVMTVSEFSKQEILKYYKFPKEKIFVTHPAADLRLFSNEAEDEKLEISEILNEKGPYVLHISSMQPRKNVPLIVAAFAKAKKDWEKKNSKWKNIKLVLAGGKGGHNYDTKIDEEIEKNKIESEIILTGYLPTKALPHLYGSARLFVFPTSYEGFGIPVLESMAAKTPVLTSSIGSVKEVGGEAATYVDINQSRTKIIQDLKNKMVELVEDGKLRDEKIRLGVERVKQFNWVELAKKTLEVYKEVISKQ